MAPHRPREHTCSTARPQRSTFFSKIPAICIQPSDVTGLRRSDDPDCRKDHAVQWLTRLQATCNATIHSRSAGQLPGTGPFDLYIYLADLSEFRGSCSCFCMCDRPLPLTLQLRGSLLLRLALPRHVLLRPSLRSRHVLEHAQATDCLLSARCLRYFVRRVQLTT